MKPALSVLVAATFLILAPFSQAPVHCDGLDGRVVLAAQKSCFP
jgi:hypothetical protein